MFMMVRLRLRLSKPGTNEYLLDVAGLPVKKVDVQVLEDFKVIPGGQSIGVKLHTLGVFVVGHHLVSTMEGERSPGEIAKIQIGDIITKINGQTIKTMGDVTPFVQEAGQKGEPLELDIQRNQEKLQTTLLPLKDKGEGTYKLGFVYPRFSCRNWYNDLLSPKFTEIWCLRSCHI